jgi:hypothetical protein
MQNIQLQLSDFLVDFISERGGVMSVFNSATVIGWWRAIKGPIGRIGKPVNNREYVFFEANGIELYIEKELVEKVFENDGRINVLMGDYGIRSIYFYDTGAKWNAHEKDRLRGFLYDFNHYRPGISGDADGGNGWWQRWSTSPD